RSPETRAPAEPGGERERCAGQGAAGAAIAEGGTGVDSKRRTQEGGSRQVKVLEIARLKHELQQSQEGRESAALDKELLEQRLQKVEQDVDSKRRTQEGASRQVKVLEIARLKHELQQSQAGRESAALDKELLEQRLQKVEQHVDSKRRTQEGASRQVKFLKIARLKHELQQSQAGGESAALDKELLEQRLQKVEQHVDSKRRTQEGASRQVKFLK
ncbi:cingulin-like, partial [Callorhinchus milii]|uniref:cingulin-like n=1 Tax=Callorhinchus milii TaxID=7868 RepID=UPI001C3F64F9